MVPVKYLELLDILADKLRLKIRNDLDVAIDEATSSCALVGTPRLRIANYGTRDLIYDGDWCVMIGNRNQMILRFDRDRTGRLIFHIDEPPRIVDLFGKVTA